MSKAKTKLFKQQLSNALEKLDEMLARDGAPAITEEQIITAFPVSNGLWQRTPAEKQPEKPRETYGALFPEFFG